MEQKTFPNWQPIRQALELAYKELGLEMTKTPNGATYPADHWNIAGLVYTYVDRQLSEKVGSCFSCRTKLDFFTVIRCLDCKTTLCEYCAKVHFGPNHAGRAKAAHGEGLNKGNKDE